MCGQLRFDVRDNVATFKGYSEVCCLSTMGIAPGDDAGDQLRSYMADLLRAFLRDRHYETGEGKVTVRGPSNTFGRYVVDATIFARGPDDSLCLRTFLWDPARRSAGS